jgi:hypothetical protein
MADVKTALLYRDQVLAIKLSKPRLKSTSAWQKRKSHNLSYLLTSNENRVVARAFENFKEQISKFVSVFRHVAS